MTEERKPCVGSYCHLGSKTGIGCSGDLPCPLEFSDKEKSRMRAEDEEGGFASPSINGVLADGPVIRDNGGSASGCTLMSGEDGCRYATSAPKAGSVSGYPDGNPKTAAGAKKPDISVVPPAGILHLATAMMNGADKYGPFNWRDKPISVRPYIAAAQRHLLAYLDGEEYSEDTVATGKPVHHLGHVMACCAILLDAREIEGGLNDNRPTVKGPAGRMIENYNKESKL